MDYASISIIALLVHIIINYDVLRHPQIEQTSEAHSSYKLFLICVLIFYLFDISWGFVHNLRNPLLSSIWTELYFMAVAVAVVFWTRYVITYIREVNFFSVALKYAGIVFLGFEFIVLVMNLFFPIMFYFDENGTYHTGKARTATMFAQILLFLATSVHMLSVTVKTRGKIRHRHRTIGGFGIAMTIFVVLATLYPVLPFYSLGYLLGICLIHTFVLEDEKEARREELERLFQVEQIREQELGSARFMAYTDPLTGVKSKNSYQEDVIGIDRRIEDGILKDFAIVVFDVNGLKLVNDTRGHEEGDRLIKSACTIICHTFKHSPIYRIGGDEFVAFLMGEDFRNRAELLETFDSCMEKNSSCGDVVIACGCTEFNKVRDNCFCTMFSRADMKMYERKKQLKTM
ncbi:MAG: GGDEF domain-containing protein [Treponema sp.]|nr:GGDEF domain-containing protein [Treponema sp.]